MKKSTKIWLITATSLVALGCIMFSVAMTKIHWDFTKLSTVKYETNTYEVTDDFNSISMLTDTADILFVQSDDKICKVVCYEMSDMKHTTTVQNDTLTINVIDEREWYDHIGIMSGGDAYLRVYLPAKTYESLTVDVTTGDVTVGRDFSFSGNVTLSVTTGDVTLSASVQGDTRLEATTGDLLVEGAHQALTVTAGTGDVTIRKCEIDSISVTTGSGDVTLEELTAAGAVRVKTTTGEQSLSRVTCGELELDVNTGDVTLTDTAASGSLRAETTTGDVTLTRADAATLHLKTTSGSVKGSLRTPKIFYTDTTSGSVDVPKSTEGGHCEIETTSGSIRITIEE